MSSFEAPIAIRAYTEKPGRAPLGARPRGAAHEPSPWTLIFDCETTIDATQSLRLSFYQVRYGESLEEEGVFYEREALTEDEQSQLEGYCDAHG